MFKCFFSIGFEQDSGVHFLRADENKSRLDEICAKEGDGLRGNL